MEEKESKEPFGSMVTIQKSVRRGIVELRKEFQTITTTKLSSNIGKDLKKMTKKISRSLRAFASSMIEER